MATKATHTPPAWQYCGVPKACFIDDRWFQRDLDAIFRPRWLVAGHVDQLQATGKAGYLIYKLGDVEVLIGLDRNGDVRAYHNFCPHRGARLCSPAASNIGAGRVVCPYHQWSFSMEDGALLNSREMHDSFDAADYGLVAVHVSVWNGLVFINLSENPRSLEEYFAGIEFNGFDLDAVKLVAYQAHEVQANWKIVIENNLECYHCPGTHPELVKVANWRDYAGLDFDEFCSMRAGGAEVFPSNVGDPNFLTGGRTVCKLPLPRLDDRDAQGILANAAWEPGVIFSMAQDMAWLIATRPIAADLTEVRQYWFVARDAVEGQDYDADDVKSFLAKVLYQDQAICELVQQGIVNPAYKSGPFNQVHQGMGAAFHRWYEQAMVSAFPETAAELFA